MCSRGEATDTTELQHRDAGGIYCVSPRLLVDSHSKPARGLCYSMTARNEGEATLGPRIRSASADGTRCDGMEAEKHAIDLFRAVHDRIFAPLQGDTIAKPAYSGTSDDPKQTRVSGIVAFQMVQRDRVSMADLTDLTRLSKPSAVLCLASKVSTTTDAKTRLRQKACGQSILRSPRLG